MRISFNFIVLLALIFSVSCKKDSGSPAPAPAPAASSNGVDVYVAGQITTTGSSIACYWKNGVRTDLTDGSHSAGAESIFVSGADIYVFGSENGIKKIWKNGVATSHSNASMGPIFIYGNDFYVAGYESNGSKSVAKVWKNGVATSLSDGSQDATAAAIFVSGSDVYVAGSESNGSKAVAKFWKNGVATSISDGLKDAFATSIQVKNNDTYVLGVENNLPVTWKNGIKTVLPIGNMLWSGAANPASTNFLNSSNQVIYAGVLMDILGISRLTVWNNAKKTVYFNDHEPNVAITGSFVFGDDIYVAGYGNGYIPLAVFWKNGELNYLEENTTSMANSIFIKAR